MIPLVGHVKELAHQKRIVLETLEQIKAERGVKKLPFEFKIGTMIEVPRGAITADEVADEAEFFSFGTNDLTQMGCGFSRDDAGQFLKDYVEMGIYEYDPFQTLDRVGVGELMRIAVREGPRTRPDIKLGICGEHGGDPASVEFCHLVGLDYVSCSPYRVPVARLAAAQAAIRYPRNRKTTRRTAKKRTNKRPSGLPKQARQPRVGHVAAGQGQQHVDGAVNWRCGIRPWSTNPRTAPTTTAGRSTSPAPSVAVLISPRAM